ncbi:MAG: hypothetical protein LBS73_03370 [Campylobacteraceae bacterium]|nr:hypothetical protein [Campylobacteraceae bacterium]
MIAQLLPVVVIAAIVIVVMMKQINKITNKIDANEFIDNPKLYADFAALIQEKIRAIRLDIDSNAEAAKFTLQESVDKANTLEQLSDMIRKLVFFETMMGRNKDAKSTEAELFAVLQQLDELIVKSLNNGENISDEIREELAQSYEKLKNSYQIQEM